MLYMKIRCITLLPLLFAVQFVSGQAPTKAELDKMMQQAQGLVKKYNNDTSLGKLLKSLQDQGKKTAGAMKGNAKVNDTETDSLPARNSKLLNALPIRPFNRAELVSYLHNLRSKLTTCLDSSYGTNIKDIPAKEVQRSGTPIGLFIKGSAKESALVALAGAEPDSSMPRV